MAALTFNGITISPGVQFGWPPQNPPIIGTATATGPTTATVTYTAPESGFIEGAKYSVSFAGVGSGSKLTIPHSTALQVGSSDFTLEAWIYIAAWPASGDHNYVIFQKGLDTSTTYEWGLGLYRANSFGNNFGFGLGYSANGSSISTVNAGSNFMTIGNWYHVAVSRNSGIGKVYYNGALAFSAELPTNNYSGPAYMGYGYSSTGINDSFNGYISNLRLVVGTGLYPSAFTPPTASLTAITDTKLLTCQSSTIIDNSTNNFTITPTSATVSSTTPAISGPLQSEIVSYTAVSNPGNITGTVTQSGSGTITVSGLLESTTYTFTVFATNNQGSGAPSSESNEITTVPVTGQTILTTGTTSWTVPEGVTSVSVVGVGGGGGYNVNGSYRYQGGGGGGALVYGNDLAVTPGEVISVQVGNGYILNNDVLATPTWFRSTSYLYAGAGSQPANAGATTTYSPGCAGGGGGAGGYLGDGAPGASAPDSQSYAGGAGGVSSGTARSGGGNGGAGGAGGTYASSSVPPYSASQTPAAGSGAGAGAGTSAYGGGGVGIFGLGTTGSTSSPTSLNGSMDVSADNVPYGKSSTGHYVYNQTAGNGAIRIIWPGNLRQFPSTRTANE